MKLSTRFQAAAAIGLCLCSIGAFAKGGGGTAVPPKPIPPSTPIIRFAGPCSPCAAGETIPVTSDSSVSISLYAFGTDRNAPALTMTSSLPGIIPTQLVPVNSPHGGGVGFYEATYVWTPNPAQVGQTAHVTFVATTAAGSTTATLNFPVQFGVAGDPSGLTANVVGNHIEGHWNAPTRANVGQLTYTLTAAYKTFIPNTTIPTIAFDLVDTTTADYSLNIPTHNTNGFFTPTTAANPNKYYALFLRGSRGNTVLGDVSVSLP